LGKCWEGIGQAVRLEDQRCPRRQGAVRSGLGGPFRTSARGERSMAHRCRDYCFRCDLLRFLRDALVNTAPKPPSHASHS
jgi:hypothetical protein